MVAKWLRRDFSGTGVTQYPPGWHFLAVTERMTGHALLCIDVSGSMDPVPAGPALPRGDRTDDRPRAAVHRRQRLYGGQAVTGGHRGRSGVPHRGRTSPGTAAGCCCGITKSPPTCRPRPHRPRCGCGCGSPAPTAGTSCGRRCSPRSRSSDRWRATGSSASSATGTSATRRPRRRRPRARSLGIRFVVRGLGAAASACPARALTPDEPDEPDRTVDVAGMRADIRSMAASLRPR